METTVKADYDSEANAIAITLAEVKPSDPPGREDRVHERGGVFLVEGKPVYVEVLYPDLGVDEPLEAAAAAHELDLESLRAAAQSALAAPDREVTLRLSARLAQA